MGRERATFRCSECGGTAPRWVGRCPACGEWNTLLEERVGATAASGATALPLAGATPATPIGEVDAVGSAPVPTGVDELDRVLGGGLVPGSVTLVGGEPGIGKSTLLTHVAAAVASSGQTVLYVSAEESAAQVRQRAERLGALAPELWLAAETALPHILAQLDAVGPDARHRRFHPDHLRPRAQLGTRLGRASA